MTWHLLAHQGGWDEILLFLVPAALGFWLLRVAERRAREKAEAERSAAVDGDPEGGSDGDGEPAA